MVSCYVFVGDFGFYFVYVILGVGVLRNLVCFEIRVGWLGLRIGDKCVSILKFGFWVWLWYLVLWAGLNASFVPVDFGWHLVLRLLCGLVVAGMDCDCFICMLALDVIWVCGLCRVWLSEFG